MMAPDRDSTVRGNDVTEHEAHRLLARAAEIDALHGTSTSLDELQAVAAEVGISPRAFDQAVREFRAGELGPPTIGAMVGRRMAKSRELALFAILLGVGFMTPGDAAAGTMIGGFGLYAVYEG